MSIAAIPTRVGSYSLGLQCLLLLTAIITFAFKLGPIAGWSFIASVLAGLVAFAAGVVAAVVTRKALWLALSAAAVFVAFFSMLIGVSISGGFGV